MLSTESQFRTREIRGTLPTQYRVMPMDDAQRFRLLGKYRTPRFHISRTVLCEVRGQVVITGMTDAPIP